MIELANALMCLGSFVLGVVLAAAMLYFGVIRDMQEQTDEFVKFIMYDRNVGAATLTQSQHKFTNASPAQKEIDKDKKTKDSVYFRALADGVIDDAQLRVLGEKEPVIGI